MRLRANHLSRMIHGEKPTRIDDDLPNAYLFKVEMIPKWSKSLMFLLTIGVLHNQPAWVVGQSQLYALLVGQLYQDQRNKVLSLCIELED